MTTVLNIFQCALWGATLQMQNNGVNVENWKKRDCWKSEKVCSLSSLIWIAASVLCGGGWTTSSGKPHWNDVVLDGFFFAFSYARVCMGSTKLIGTSVGSGVFDFAFGFCLPSSNADTVTPSSTKPSLVRRLHFLSRCCHQSVALYWSPYCSVRRHAMVELSKSIASKNCIALKTCMTLPFVRWYDGCLLLFAFFDLKQFLDKNTFSVMFSVFPSSKTSQRASENTFSWSHFKKFLYCPLNSDILDNESSEHWYVVTRIVPRA